MTPIPDEPKTRRNRWCECGHVRDAHTNGGTGSCINDIGGAHQCDRFRDDFATPMPDEGAPRSVQDRREAAEFATRTERFAPIPDEGAREAETFPFEPDYDFADLDVRGPFEWEPHKSDATGNIWEWSGRGDRGRIIVDGVAKAVIVMMDREIADLRKRLHTELAEARRLTEQSLSALTEANDTMEMWVMKCGEAERELAEARGERDEAQSIIAKWSEDARSTHQVLAAKSSLRAHAARVLATNPTPSMQRQGYEDMILVCSALDAVETDNVDLQAQLARANAVIERVGEQTEQNEGTYIECVECYRRPSGAWHLCHWHDGFDEANDRVRTILEGGE